MSMLNQRNTERERFWGGVVSGWKQPGRAVCEYCGFRGVREPNFYAWQRSLAEREVKRPQFFVPVRIISDAVIEVVLPSSLIPDDAVTR